MEEPTFESERIRELKNERISLQKKTFTKWMNTFLQDGVKVDDLFEDLTDGRILIRLLESISEEKVGRIARGKQRIHKLENVSKALMFLRKSVKLESIGPEDIVDGKQDLILGLIWMIILRFQISKVENESGSKDAKSAKDALLLWCQRKTKGYAGVDIKNFTTSWKNGLAFNALIHKHRPDLLDFSRLQAQQYRSNLSQAFTVAEEQLGVAKLLDPEDFDSPKPDEKSVMTYVSMLYQYFAKMKNEETGGKRIAKILDVMIDIDKMKQKYEDLVKTLLEWIKLKILWLEGDVPKQSLLLQRSMNEFKALRTVEKPKRYIERANIEEMFFVIQTKSNAYRLRPYRPPDGAALSDINIAWLQLEKEEHQREIRLREELARQERLSQLAERFEKKAKLRDSWLDEMLSVIEGEETSKSLQTRDVNISLKRHEAIETDVKARGIKVETVKSICQELCKEKYEEYQGVLTRQNQIEEKWSQLLERLQKRRLFLVTLNDVTPLISDIEKVCSHLKEAEANLSSEELKKDLYGIEDQLQKHVLQESQLTSYKAQIQPVIARCNELFKRNHPQSQLIRDKLQHMIKLFEDDAKLSNTKRKMLQESRNLYYFKETVKKESVFIQDKLQLAGSREVGKDFVSFIRLQKKLQALEAEIEACEARCDAVCRNGYQLMSDGNSSTDEIKQITAELQSSVENLRKLAGIRAERLNEAAQSFQYYSDANDAESWIGEHMQLVASEDYGKDTETTKYLIQRHQQITEEITAFNDDMQTLQDECKQIEETDNRTEANTTEISSKPHERECEEIEVETETEDEETIEKEVEEKVIKEFNVAQVAANYPYNGEGLSMKKGEVFYVVAKTNKDWWSVRRRASKESGYVPTAYIKEIEPKVFRKPVTEKVVIQEKVKVKRKKMKKVRVEKKTKGKLADKRAKRSSSILRRKHDKQHRKPRFTQHFDRENVTTRHLAIVVAYAKLKTAVEERGQKLEEALAYFEFCAAHDAIMTWIADQIRYLDRRTTFSDKMDIDTIKKLLEHVEHEISANEKLYAEAAEKGNIVLGRGNPCYAEDTHKRLNSMRQKYQELLALKESRQNDLIKSHGIDIISKSCAELIDWISEKSNQLVEGHVGTNQETIRALQRRHQNFEHELVAIGDKVLQLKTDSKNLRHVHPSVIAEVDKNEKEVDRFWKALKEKTENRKRLLQEAYGLQGFLADYRDIAKWAKDACSRFSQSDLPRDLTVVEDVIREHNEAWLETKGNVQRLMDVANNGEALTAKSALPENIDSLISELKIDQKRVPELWEARSKQLSLCKDALVFCRDADAFVSRSAVIQKLLSSNDNGASMENVVTLLKQVEGLSQKVYQQEERLKKLIVSAEEVIEANSYDSTLIEAKKEDISKSQEKTKILLHQRENTLKQSKDFQRFHADIEEFISWINDKLALVNDDSYKELSSLQSKVLKHQALQAEVISNQVTKNRLLQVGEELLSEDNFASDKTEDLMTLLNERWQQLENGVKLKQDKLEQATKARAFSNAFDDFEIWCDQIQNVLSSQELGDDLTSVKFLRAKHQVTENEITQHHQDLNLLEQDTLTMIDDGNFKAESMTRTIDLMKQRMAGISDTSKRRRAVLDDSYLLQQFLFEINVHLSWIDEHLTQINNAEIVTNLTTAKRLLNRHEAVQNELNSHSTVINKLIERGMEMAKTRPLRADEANKACEHLQHRFISLQKVSEARKDILQQNCEAFQFLVDANEMENWLDEKSALVGGLQQSKDLDSTERQLNKAKVLMDDLKHSKQSIETFKRKAKEIHIKSNPRKEEVVHKCKTIIEKDQKLTGQLQKLHKSLENLYKVYQFFYDAENLRDWVSNKLRIASAEGYGKDLEHWQAISQKFDDFKVSIASGKTTYMGVMQLADEIIASNGPHTTNVSSAKDKLSAMWNRLMDKVKQKNSRLFKAGELHKFNSQVNDIVANLKEKENKININDLGDDVISTESKVRAHDAALNEIEAVSKQIEGAEEDARKLMASYPGKTAEQIKMHQSYVKKFYADILRKAKNIKGKLHGSVDYHRLNSEIAKLLTWCKETKDIVESDDVLEGVDEIEEVMDKIDDLKLEIDGKEDKFGFVVEAGEQMVEEGHHATEEIQEKLEELISCREELHNAWIQRKQYLTETYDFAMFCREVNRISSAMSSNKAFLKSISGGQSRAEIESMSKRVQKVKNMFESQLSKLEAALDLGEQLIGDNHFASEKIENRVQEVIRARDSLRKEISEREEFLKGSLALAEFRMQNEEIQSWVNEKLSNIKSRQIDMSNIGLYATIHKSDLVEFNARNSAKESLRNNGKELINAKHFASGEIEDSILETFRLFEGLDKEIKEVGRKFDGMRNIAELKRDIDFAEAHITEKERSLATDEIGQDYDKCQILRKHLDNTIKHMKADEERINSINEKAKSLSRIKSEFAEELVLHLRMLNSRWDNLKLLAFSRKTILDKSVKVLLFRKNTDEIALRINEKISLLANSHVASDLAGVQKQMRKHALLESDVEAIEITLEELDSNAREIVNESPENLTEIQTMQTDVIEIWEKLVDLMDERQSSLHAAEHLYRFQTDVSSLSSWMGKARERLRNIMESRNVKETKAMLDKHNQIKSELKIREEVFDRVLNYGEALVTDGGLQPEEVHPKLQQLEKERGELVDLLQEKDVDLKHSFDIQRFGSELEQMQSWLDRRHEVLSSEDFGSSLDEVERLLVQHGNMRNTIDQFLENLNSLSAFAAQMKNNKSKNSIKMSEKYEDIQSRMTFASSLVDDKLKKLHESQLFFDFLQQANRMLSWIKEKLKYANSKPETTTNLQHQKKVYDAVEAEMVANKKNVDEAVSSAVVLIDRSIRTESVNHHKNSLLESFHTLETALERKCKELQEKLTLSSIEDALGEMGKWLDTTERWLRVENLGKDMDSVVSLQTKHKETTNEITERNKVMKDMEEMIDADIQIYKLQLDEIKGRYDDICERFRDLATLSNCRKMNLEYSFEFHSLCQEIDDEKLWIKEKYAYLETQEFGSDLTGAKHVFKKHQLLESEIKSHEDIIICLLKKLDDVSDDSIFKDEVSGARERLDKDWKSLKKLSQEKNKKIREFVYFLKLVADINQAMLWLKDYLPVLQSYDYGKDESTASTMLRKNAAMQNDITAFSKTVKELGDRVQNMIGGNFCGESERNRVENLQKNLTTEYQSVLKLGNQRSKRLNESIQEHRFSRLAKSITSWLEEKRPFVYSKDNGERLEQTENILKNFQEFMSELKSIEATKGTIAELVIELEKNGHSNAKNIGSTFAQIEGEFTTLKKASLGRIQNLGNAKQIHVFEQTLDELREWIKRKFHEMIAVDMKNDLQSLAELRKTNDAFIMDLNALSSKIKAMHEAYHELCQQIPNAVASLKPVVEEIDNEMEALARKSSQTSTELVKAEDFKSFCLAAEDLRTWLKDRTAIVKSNVQSLLSKSVDHENAYIIYRDHLTERDARQCRIDNLLKDATRLTETIPDTKSIIDTEAKLLCENWQDFQNELKGFQEDLDDTKDSETLKDDLVNLEKWILANDGKCEALEGSSLDEIEEMLRQHDDFEKSIAVQEGRFQSTLGRLSKYTEKVESKYAKKNHRDAAKSSGRNDADGLKASVGLHSCNYGFPGPNPDNKKEAEQGDHSGGELKRFNSKQKYDNLNGNKRPETMRVMRPAEDITDKTGDSTEESRFENGIIHETDGKRKVPDEDLKVKDVSSKVQNEASSRGVAGDKFSEGAIVSYPESRVSAVAKAVAGNAFDSLQDEELLVNQWTDDDVYRSQDANTNTLSHKLSRIDKKRIQTGEHPSQLVAREEPPNGDEAQKAAASIDKEALRVMSPRESNEVIVESSPDANVFPEAERVKHDTDTAGSDSETATEGSEKNIQHRIEDDGNPPESFSNAEIVDESIMPEQVQVVESSIDFAIFDDNYDDDQDKVIASKEQPVDSETDVFKQISNEGDFEFLGEASRQEEVNNNRKLGCEDQLSGMEEYIDFNDETLGGPKDQKHFKSEGFDRVYDNSKDGLGWDESETNDKGGIIAGNSFLTKVASEPTDGMLFQDDALSISDRSNSEDGDAHLVGLEDKLDSDDIEINLAENTDFVENNLFSGVEVAKKSDGFDERVEKPGLKATVITKDQTPQAAVKLSDDTSVGGVIRRSPVPSILVSHASSTEDEMMQQFDTERSNIGVLDFAGNLEFKEEIGSKGKKSLLRKWRDFYAVISESFLICYDSEEHFKKRVTPRKELNLESAMVTVEPGQFNDTLRLSMMDRSEFLVRSDDADVFDDFLMAVSECAEMNSKEDTISLPPAPSPPLMPDDVDEEKTLPRRHQDEDPPTVADDLKVHESDTKKSSIPAPEISSDESDEFDDILPPPAPVLSLPGLTNITERKMSLGLLDLVGRSTALADYSSDDEDEDESRSSGTFDADILEAKQDGPNDETPPRKLSKMNKLFSRTEPSFADETTPITPFGADVDHNELLDEVTTGDLSEYLGPKPKTHQRPDDKAQSVLPKTQRPTNLNLPGSGGGFSKESFNRSPSSPGKEQKKRGFLGGIFRKKK